MMASFSKPFPDDAAIINGLREGDELVFKSVLERYSGALVRLALTFVPSQAIAEEVVQETWLGVWKGIGKFEGRSSFRTWLYTILVNRARTRGMQERRYTSLDRKSHDDSDNPSSWEDSLFISEGPMKGQHVTPPKPWEVVTPESEFLLKECGEVIERAIAGLSVTQRQVITLRDMEGVDAREVCHILEISDANQRVLLHRARMHVRNSLDAYLKK